jgi:mannose-6-phosphate isomerase-like protein (cupin superfamily)
MSEGNPIVRRIVTGHDSAGKAVVWNDAPATNFKRQASEPSTHTSVLIWVTERLPADMLGEEDTGLRILGTAPPEGGSRFAVIEFQPVGIKTNLHRTDTIDYVVCLSGEIDMELDDSTVRLQPGDVMVQRGTNHCWINRGKVPARIAVILVDGWPKRAGSVTGGGQASSYVHVTAAVNKS